MKKLITLLLFATVFVGCKTRGIEIQFERSERILYKGYAWDIVQLNDSIFVAVTNDGDKPPIFFKNTSNFEEINKNITPIIDAKKIKDSEITIEK